MQSITTGEVPDDWKKALVSPIFKKGVKADPANYRPISLTCLCCNVLEHIVLSHMAKHLSSHNILDAKHGFRERLSTVTQLITSVHDWATIIEHRGQTDVVLLNFSKAFDKVSHRHLSTKLHYYGIRGSTLSWINAFITENKQSLLMSTCHSGLMFHLVFFRGQCWVQRYSCSISTIFKITSLQEYACLQMTALFIGKFILIWIIPSSNKTFKHLLSGQTTG